MIVVKSYLLLCCILKSKKITYFIRKKILKPAKKFVKLSLIIDKLLETQLVIKPLTLQQNINIFDCARINHKICKWNTKKITFSNEFVNDICTSGKSGAFVFITWYCGYDSNNLKGKYKIFHNMLHDKMTTEIFENEDLFGVFRAWSIKESFYIDYLANQFMLMKNDATRIKMVIKQIRKIVKRFKLTFSITDFYKKISYDILLVLTEF